MQRFRFQSRLLLPGLALTTLLTGCGPVDQKALQKLACEKAAASIDMQSVATLDTLRKALGVAPGVDPIEHCRSLGAAMEPPAGNAGEQPQGAAADDKTPAQEGGDARESNETRESNEN